MSKHSTSSPDLCVLLPVKNEEKILVQVVSELSDLLSSRTSLSKILFLVVDDCSSDDGIQLLRSWFEGQKHELEVLRLDKPHGLNMALLQGIKHIATINPAKVLIMDADGQDNVAAVPQMLELSDEHEIVIGGRGERSEGIVFRTCYFLFQLIMRIFHGEQLRISHFCVVQPQVVTHLAKFAYVDCLSAMLHSLPFNNHILYVARRPRIDGKSKFSFFTRVLLALAIISYYRSTMLALCTTMLMLIAALGLVSICFANVFTAILYTCIALILGSVFYAFIWLLSKRELNMPSRE